MMSIPVSIVVPMHNAQKYILKVLESIFSQEYPGSIEVIVVDDGSTDNSVKLVKDFECDRSLILIEQSNHGAAHATNQGIKAAEHDIVCSVDSDVILRKGWLEKIVKEFDDPSVGAVQGYYKTPEDISFLGRMMGYDIEKRYDDIIGKYVTHVCTGNTAYRRSVLKKVGFFDPTFIYGYDNDMSYRMVKAGFKLVFKKEALCDHYWKEDFRSYIKQQYRAGYGRLQLAIKHKDKVSGDSVSGLRMILQVPLTLLAVILLLFGAMLYALDITAHILLFGFLIFLTILVDRSVFAASIVRKQKDVRALLLPILHLIRNIIWCGALLKWTFDKMRSKYKPCPQT